MRTLATPRCAVVLLALALSSPARAQEAPQEYTAPVLAGLALGAADGQLVVTLPGVHEASVFTLEDPPRVVIDAIARSALPGAPGAHRASLDAFGVRALRTSQYDPDPVRPVTRVVLDMDERTFPPVGDGPLVRTSIHSGYVRAIVRAALEGEGEPIVIGSVPERVVALSLGRTHDEAPDAPTRGLELPQDPAAALEAISKARGSVAYSQTVRPPHVSVDPTEEMIDTRQSRLWDRRAEELVVDARLRRVAGDNRTGLANLHKVFRYYPSSRHVYEAHTVAARLYADLGFDHESLSHVERVLASPSAPESLVVASVEIAAGYDSRSIVWQTMLRVHELAESRLGDTSLVRRLGGRLGILLSDRGEKVDRAVGLLRRALEDDPDADWAAALHEGFARCHLARGDTERAARQYFFASQLLRAENPEHALALRLSAADAYFESDDLPRAAEQYGVVADREGAPAELRAWSLFQLGNCHFRARAYVNAEHAYRRLAEEHPGSFWARQATTRLSMLERTAATR